MDWFLYDKDLRHERVENYFLERLCIESSALTPSWPVLPFNLPRLSPPSKHLHLW